MPVGTCQTHGWINSFAHVCAHIAEDVSAEHTVRHFNTYFIGMEGVPDISYFTIMHFCDECVQTRDLPPADKVIPEELWDWRNEQRWRTCLVCAACFKQNSRQEIPTDRFAA